METNSPVAEEKLDRVQFTYLRRILRIWWLQWIQSDTVSQVTGIKKISDEIQRGRWNWIGHLLGRERNDDCMVAMEWQPEGKRRVGRPKPTWKRMVEKESSWAEVWGAAQDKTGWQEKIAALCVSWRGENEQRDRGQLLYWQGKNLHKVTMTAPSVHSQNFPLT